LPVPGDDELSAVQELGTIQKSPGKIGAIKHRFEEVRTLVEGYSLGPLSAMKLMMVDTNDLPPKCPECLSRLPPCRGIWRGSAAVAAQY
jgi:hypothetical protein